jgi:hypothetical protein
MLCPTGALLPAVDGPGPFLSDNEGAFVIFIFVLIAVGINIWMLFNKCCLHKVFNPFRIDYQIAKPNQVTPSTEAIVDAAKDAPPVATYERRRSSTTLTGERRLSFDDDANAAPSFNRHNKTVLTEELSKGQGLKRAKTVGLTLTTLNEETDASMMGCRPDAKTQEKIDAILSGQRVPGVSFAHLLPTEKERFIQMTKDFPCYFATTLLHLILPTLAGCIPVVILGVRYRALRNQLPDFVGSAGDFNGAQIHVSARVSNVEAQTLPRHMQRTTPRDTCHIPYATPRAASNDTALAVCGDHIERLCALMSHRRACVHLRRKCPTGTLLLL